MSDLLAWTLRRRALVQRSLGRRRILRPTPAPPPDLIAAKFASLFDVTIRRHLGAMVNEIVAASPRVDAKVTPLVKRVGEVTFHYGDRIKRELNDLAAKMVSEVDGHNKASMSKLWRQLVGVPFADGESYTEKLDAHRSNNVALITNMTQSSLDRILAVLQANEGQPRKKLSEELRKVVDISASRARLIARDQTLKINGQLTQERQTSAGITKYEWVTSGDERVRDAHQALNGQEFDWQHPPVVDKKRGRREHPGGDYQCRCVANPVIDLDALEAVHTAAKPAQKSQQLPLAFKPSPLGEVYKPHSEVGTDPISVALDRLAATAASERKKYRKADIDVPLKEDYDVTTPDGPVHQWGKHFVGRVSVAIDSLLAGQPTVGREAVEAYIRSKRDTPIVVVRQKDGRLSVVDGHHRLTAAKLKGETEILADLYSM